MEGRSIRKRGQSDARASQMRARACQTPGAFAISGEQLYRPPRAIMSYMQRSSEPAWMRPLWLGLVLLLLLLCGVRSLPPERAGQKSGQRQVYQVPKFRTVVFLLDSVGTSAAFNPELMPFVSSLMTSSLFGEAQSCPGKATFPCVKSIFEGRTQRQAQPCRIFPRWLPINDVAELSRGGRATAGRDFRSHDQPALSRRFRRFNELRNAPCSIAGAGRLRLCRREEVARRSEHRRAAAPHHRHRHFPSAATSIERNIWRSIISSGKLPHASCPAITCM